MPFDSGNISFNVYKVLEDIPEDHLEMIRNWFSYWNNHREILLDGDFIPSNPGANYPILTAVKDDIQISTLFENMAVAMKLPKPVIPREMIAGSRRDTLQ